MMHGEDARGGDGEMGLEKTVSPIASNTFRMLVNTLFAGGGAASGEDEQGCHGRCARCSDGGGAQRKLGASHPPSHRAQTPGIAR